MENAKAEARRFKALCDENRLHILEILQNGEVCACKLVEALPMGQSTLSYHMKILCESGIVESRQAGKWTHYSISARGSAEAVASLQALTARKPEGSAGNTGCDCSCGCEEG